MTEARETTLLDISRFAIFWFPKAELVKGFKDRMIDKIKEVPHPGTGSSHSAPSTILRCLRNTINPSKREKLDIAEYLADKQLKPEYHPLSRSTTTISN
jgi:hypothetical protein